MEINDKHLKPWSDICAINDMFNTPLSPYLHKEDVTTNHIYLNGEKLKSIGFVLKHPNITEELLRKVIDDYKAMGLFPSIYKLK